MHAMNIPLPRPRLRLADFLALRDVLASPELAQYMRPRQQPAEQRRFSFPSPIYGRGQGEGRPGGRVAQP